MDVWIMWALQRNLLLLIMLKYIPQIGLRMYDIAVCGHRFPPRQEVP